MKEPCTTTIAELFADNIGPGGRACRVRSGGFLFRSAMSQGIQCEQQDRVVNQSGETNIPLDNLRQPRCDFDNHFLFSQSISQRTRKIIFDDTSQPVRNSSIITSNVGYRATSGRYVVTQFRHVSIQPPHNSPL